MNRLKNEFQELRTRLNLEKLKNLDLEKKVAALEESIAVCGRKNVDLFNAKQWAFLQEAVLRNEMERLKNSVDFADRTAFKLRFFEDALIDLFGVHDLHGLYHTIRLMKESVDSQAILTIPSGKVMVNGVEMDIPMQTWNLSELANRIKKEGQRIQSA